MTNRAYTDPFEVLGLPPTASREEVKGAFRRLALKCHPDVDPSPQAAARFTEVRLGAGGCREGWQPSLAAGAMRAVQHRLQQASSRCRLFSRFTNKGSQGAVPCCLHAAGQTCSRFHSQGGEIECKGCGVWRHCVAQILQASYVADTALLPSRPCATSPYACLPLWPSLYLPGPALQHSVAAGFRPAAASWHAYAEAAPDAHDSFRLLRSRHAALWFCAASLAAGFGIFYGAVVSHEW